METSHRSQHEKSEGAGTRKQETGMATLYKESTSKHNNFKKNKHDNTCTSYSKSILITAAKSSVYSGNRSVRSTTHSTRREIRLFTMSGITTKKKGHRQGGVTATAVSQSESNKKRGRRKSPTATAAPPPGASRQLLLSPPSLLSPACAVSVSSSLTSSSTPRRKVVPPTETGTGNDHESSPSKFLCLEQEELKVDLACALEVSAENLVETLTSLLTKLNDTAPTSTAVAPATATSPATVVEVSPPVARPVVYSDFTRPSSLCYFDVVVKKDTKLNSQESKLKQKNTSTRKQNFESRVSLKPPR
ncbi:hypothetical protein FRACYDRAFT_241080 [Fragilariopsis cylindrus CCMP1102]|uniref:Uncharacterized protein n=1 Tax=Fragilariopsis cylindrus CCMP1102 TaxID=635003 RepID=A0A1E7F8S9_9STRA|nr:hypothetical protein FRACYDRAFT_241080 [Fragilariopsis cylindrus CCMP1102]|eukprot:OEU14534.1 hypothetical protein FRACYDRAFT_241080 [Fragilariopsis cylindrus CCMP1102]